jgi:hypothetical protein
VRHDLCAGEAAELSAHRRWRERARLWMRGPSASRFPGAFASSRRRDRRGAPCTRRRAVRAIRRVMSCVPLTSDRPSFAPSRTLAMPAARSLRTPSSSARATDISFADERERKVGGGARSPLAPTDLRWDARHEVGAGMAISVLDRGRTPDRPWQGRWRADIAARRAPGSGPRRRRRGCARGSASAARSSEIRTSADGQPY